MFCGDILGQKSKRLAVFVVGASVTMVVLVFKDVLGSFLRHLKTAAGVVDSS